ncbi:alpha-amylase [Clavulina sp. PMI_390]|nr:alpha-amylase [Clavulina sp. PMI_390]
MSSWRVFAIVALSVILSLESSFVSAATAQQWRSRSIYQVMTDRFALPQANPPLPTDQCNVTAHDWCGGTWQSIEQNLDYIQNMGFTAIWISPVSQNIPGPTAYGNAYHGYWIQNVTLLNDKFGTSDDLKSLISALHARDMYIMIDVVVNNVAATTSSFTPSYSPYLFDSAQYYHPYTPIDWGNSTSEQLGWLGDANLPLPDVNTSDPYVRSTYQTWIKSFMEEYEVDGLRIDAAKHVEPGFWGPFCGENGAAGVFCIGEVYGPDVGSAAAWQGPLDSVLNYPAYYAVTNAFSIPGPSNISGLVQMYNQSNTMYKDTTVLGNFLENQDLPRWAGVSIDPMTLANALVYTFMTEGIPIVYYGTEQAFTGSADPYNREPLWPSAYNTSTFGHGTIAVLNQFRNYLVSNVSSTTSGGAWLDQKSKVLNWGSVDLVISKGGVISVMNSLGSPPSNYTTVISNTGYHTATILRDILTCTAYSVASNGALALDYNLGAHPLVLYPDVWLQGSGMCGYNSTLSSQNQPGNSTSTHGGAGARAWTPTPLASLASTFLLSLPLAMGMFS